jgi:RimJ/RimL family protein N-acetyltransferase
MLSEQLAQDYKEKKSYCIIWELNGNAVGHSNVNKIIFGVEAYMHIHIWKPEIRKSGLGETFARKTIPYFFENLQLQKLYCEPYALNPAPNNLLRKLGFQFLQSYETVPGYLNFLQEVNLWELSRVSEVSVVSEVPHYLPRKS